MAQDNEIRLVNKVIRDRNIAPVLERGINEGWFNNDTAKTLFRFVKRHYDRYGEVPTAVTVKDNYPNADVRRVEDTLEYLIDQLVAYRRWQRLGRAVREGYAAVAAADTDAVYSALADGVREVDADSATKARHVDITADPLKRWEEYLEREERGTSILGIPCGFKTIDLSTAGFQPGQLVTLIAPPKAGKSTLMLRMAANVHALAHVPMFQSFEMSNTEQGHRYDAMRAGISHARLIRGGLRKEERSKYRTALEQMVGEPRFPMLDAAEGVTVSTVRALIEKHKPEIVFIDGVYLMFDEITGERNTAQALTNITRSFKSIAQVDQVPIIISTQALLWKMRGGKVRADSIGYSSSFFQDSDVILGLDAISEDDEDSGDLARTLRVVGSRNSGQVETLLDWDWEIGKFEERYAA